MNGGHAYTPREGSYPGRALAFLQANGETPTGPLSAAIGCDPNELNGMIEHAVRNGAIAVEKRDGLRYWRVGDGVPMLREKDDPESEPPPRRHRRVRPIAPPVEQGVDMDRATPRKAAPPAPAPKDERQEGRRPAGDFTVALCSDGWLHLWLESRFVCLTPTQTRELVHYLDRLAPEAAA